MAYKIQYSCTNCGNIVNEDDLRCSKCKSTLAQDGAIKTKKVKIKEETKSEDIKIKVPFWLHIIGFFSYLVFMMIINLNSVIILKIGGILILICMFKFIINEFRIAKKENKNPYFAYLYAELIILIGFSIFATLFSNLDWYSKIIVIALFVLLGLLIKGILKISEIISKDSMPISIIFFIIGIILSLILFSKTILFLSA